MPRLPFASAGQPAQPGSPAVVHAAPPVGAPSPAQYRHIIWDWNGTLLDDISIVVDVMNGLLRRRGLPLLSRERYCEIFDFPVRDYYAAAGFDFDREPFEILAAEWVAGFDGQWRHASLKPGAAATLTALADAGFTHSVLSAAHRDLLQEQAHHFGVHAHFEALVGIDDHHAESKLDHGRTWIRQLDVPPGEILLVGDTLHDYEVAAALGIDCVLIADGHQSRARLERCGVPVLDTLVELTTILAPRSPSLPRRELRYD